MRGGSGLVVPTCVSKRVVTWDSGRNGQTQPRRADDVTRESGNECAIRCHYSSARATYSSADVRRNIITSAEQFASRCHACRRGHVLVIVIGNRVPIETERNDFLSVVSVTPAIPDQAQVAMGLRDIVNRDCLAYRINNLAQHLTVTYRARQPS